MELIEGLKKPEFNPSRIYDGAAWFRASNVTKDGSDKISEAINLFENGNDATASGSAQPTWIADVQNGKPGMQFTTDDWFSADNLASIGTSPHTLFIVTAPDVVVSPAVMTAFQTNGDGSANQSKFEIWTPGQFRHTIQSTQVLDSGDFTGIPSIFAATRDTTLTTTWLNGAPTTTPSFAAALPATCNEFSIGQEFDSATASNFYEGYIFEIILYGRVLNATERLLVNQYLSSEYAIPLA